MKFFELQQKIKTNLFTIADATKYFPNEKLITLRTQLSRFVKKRLIYRVKRELYCFNLKEVDELELANFLYSPSYISCESALNYYGIIPDVPQAVTSVTTITSKKIKTIFGIYHYFKINPKFFFGFDIVKTKNGYLKIAKKEKALLDFFYLRKINKIDDLRLDLKAIDFSLLKKYLKSYPRWLKKIRI